MGENWKYYDAADFSNWKRKQGSAYKIPPRANFLAAANHIRNVLEGKKINWALMGSLAMLCLGVRREMPDIHVVYDDKEFARIKAKLERDRRVRMPKSMNPLFPSKLLISTGPKYKDASCTENVDVEVDLVPPGSHGTPSNDILRNSQVMLRMNQGEQAINFRGLNMLYLVKTTLHYCKSQDVVWDARKDLIFLCRNYGQEIGAIRDQLNVREVQEKFLETGLFSRLPSEDQRTCYNVLLGKDPPPAMSLIPAPSQGHREATSSRPNTRPQMPSHKSSSPALSTTMQQQSNFLIPPLPGKSKPRQAGPTSSATMQNFAPPKLQNQGAPRSSSADRESRSRYRTPNSAPNTPSSFRKVSPEARAQEASRPKSMDIRGLQQPTGNPTCRAQMTGVQNVAHVAHIVRPQVVNNTAPSPTSGKPKTLRPQKSLPAMIVNQTVNQSARAFPVYAHGQGDIPPMPQGPAKPQQGRETAVLLPASGTSPLRNRRDSPQEVPRVASTQSLPRLPAANKDHPPAATQLPSPRHAHETHPPQHTTRSLPPNHQTGVTLEKALRLVGPEGLYVPPSKLRTQVEKGQAVAPPASSSTRPAPSTDFVFELDASSPQTTSAPPHSMSQEFVAELPAEMDGASLMQGQTHHLAPKVISPPLHSVHAAPSIKYEDSPVSPPLDFRLIPAPAQGQQPYSLTQTQQAQAQAYLHPQPQQQQQIAPPKPRTLSDPFDALPSSLTIGGPGTRRSPSNSISQEAAPSLPLAQTLFPESNKYITNPNRKSMYTAYSAPAPTSPPKQPTTAPAQLQQPPPSGNTRAHVQAPLHWDPAPGNDAAPFHAIFTPGSVPSLVQSTHHTYPPFVQGPVVSNAQYQPPSNAPPPSVLRAGPAVMPPIPRHLLPNPLGANPPTPPPSVDLAKHELTQSHNEHANVNREGAVLAGARVVGATTTYAAYAHQHQIQPQHQHNEELRYNSQQVPRHAGMHEHFYQQPQFKHGEFMPMHQRTVSHESNTSTTSHDSEKLAMEYKVDLPNYGSGYGNMRVYQEARHDANNEMIYDFT